MNLARWLDELGPSYPEATVALVDALRNYIRANDQLARDLLHEGQITIEEFRRPWPHMKQCRSVLRELESMSVSENLCGVLRR